jgi:RNA polymerase-binding protein DksA
MATTTTPHLTPGQRALLEAALVQRQHAIDRQLALHHQGLSRTEHAASLLDQDAHDAAQHEGAREVEQQWSDRQMQALGEVSDALRRVHDEAYGQCLDCGGDIPFDRLKVEPWARRCVACASLLEHPNHRR